MESVIRAATIYLVLILLFRLSGKRTLAQATPFDMVLLLIISEAVQNYLVGQDYSFTNVFLVVVTLLGLDIGISLLMKKSATLSRLVDDDPVIILQDGKPLEERMKKTRMEPADILDAARETQGLERLDQIKYAVLERSGKISIIPKEPA